MVNHNQVLHRTFRLPNIFSTVFVISSMSGAKAWNYCSYVNDYLSHNCFWIFQALCWSQNGRLESLLYYEELFSNFALKVAINAHDWQEFQKIWRWIKYCWTFDEILQMFGLPSVIECSGLWLIGAFRFVTGYFNCQCSSAFCLSLTYCLLLFRITLWPSAGKELSPWLFTCAVFILVPS